MDGEHGRHRGDAAGHPGRTGAARRRADRILVAAAGGGLILAGVVLLVLPGPGIALLLAGLAVLATRFDWAHRLLEAARRRVRRWQRRHSRDRHERR